MTDILFIHVEEPSMEQAIKPIVREILRGTRIEFEIIDHGSKNKLRKNIHQRHLGYKYRIDNGENIGALVIVDRDEDDCQRLKKELEDAAEEAGLISKTRQGQAPCFRVVNRIAVEELEAWFIGSPDAICSVYPRIPTTFRNRKKYREPDNINGGTWEALRDLLKKYGYLPGRSSLPKIDVAREVAVFIDPDKNDSPSFRCMIDGIRVIRDCLASCSEQETVG